jgi:hypothetical protein
LRARPLGPVHVEGQAEDETDGPAIRSKGEQARRVGLEGLSGDGFDAGRKPAVGIGDRNADGLGPEIETEQRAPCGQEGSCFGERTDHGSHACA